MQERARDHTCRSWCLRGYGEAGASNAAMANAAADAEDKATVSETCSDHADGAVNVLLAVDISDISASCCPSQEAVQLPLGCPSAPTIPTTYYVQLADVNGVQIATTAKRLQQIHDGDANNKGEGHDPCASDTPKE